MMKYVLALSLGLAPALAHAADISGLWLTEEGKARVTLTPCGAKLCAKIVWLREPNDKHGKPLIDIRNEDKSLRTRPILNLPLAELAKDSSGKWRGQIYNPEDGKTYTAKAELEADGTLVMKGCVLAGLLCGDETWTRLPSPPQ